MDRLEAAAALADQAVGSGGNVASSLLQNDGLEMVQEVEQVPKPFTEKDMLCPYSNKVMTTPMASKNCSHRIEKESLRALVEYTTNKQKELKAKKETPACLQLPHIWLQGHVDPRQVHY